VKREQFSVFLIAILLAACTGQGTPTLYISPTRESTLINSPNSPPSNQDLRTSVPSPQPSPSPACTPGLAFIEDITIPDGTIVNPGEILDKRWLVENNGSCNWDHRFSLKLVAGPKMSAKNEYALFPARSGSQATINILFTAPQELGVQRSAWQAYDPQGNLFGDPIFIEVVVQNP
jgi:hypothetical protein